MPEIIVAAGTNGAGKSSIVQPFLEGLEEPYFNPDQHTRELVRLGIPEAEANARAWQVGRDRLRDAVDQNRSYAFETTLGGHTIAFELMRALAFGRTVNILFIGLSSVDLHIRRVAARVARGGHDIPDETIRKRYDDSRTNLLAFIGTRAWIRVWDNSEESADGAPSGARQIFDVRGSRLVLPPKASTDPEAMPVWARPLLGQALKLGLSRAPSSTGK
ncbi:MAG TPA: hypothetical protein VM240_02665 [Verrucomicrobiae bacterium]|nr:hypothetical protein [Verrucomicrobiae bacterium]